MSVIIDQDPLVGVSVGGYRIEQLLGAGGMGLVYLARHEFIDRRFAVKAIKPDLANDAALASNFLREAQTLSALKHPNIVDIVGAGKLPDGRMYMVMEYLEGRTLEDELSERQPELPRVLHLCDAVLAALEAAHSVGVVHRDLKPSNIFLGRGSGGVETVKLLDFGLAKVQPVALAAGGGGDEAGKSLIAGTAEYVAPEQALGQRVTPASDLYAFGVMLYELLAGRRPYDVDDDDPLRVVRLIKAHLELDPPPFESLGVEVHPELKALTFELLAKKPEQRPPSAAVVRARLELVRAVVAPGARPIALTTLSPSGPVPGATPSGKLPQSMAAPVPTGLTGTLDADAEAAALRKKDWRVPAVTALALVALIGLLVFEATQPEAPAPDLAATADAGVSVAGLEPPAPVVAPPAPEPVKSPPAAVEPTAPQVKSAPPPEKPQAPALKLTVATKKTSLLTVDRSDCEPDEKWKAAARVHLQELQQLAANGDEKRWAEFQKVEPRLSGDIDAALTGEQCEAVEQHIRRLAISWSK